MTRRGVRRIVGPIAIGASMLVVTGCIGTTSREDFLDLVAARGGGVSASVIDDLRTVLAAEVGTPDPEIRSLTINFSTAFSTVEVRNPAAPDELDEYSIVGSDLSGIKPVILSADEDLDMSTIALSAVALDAIETMADEALAEFGVTGGYVTILRVSATSEPVLVTMALESQRATGIATFDATGRLLEVRR